MSWPLRRHREDSAEPEQHRRAVGRARPSSWYGAESRHGDGDVVPQGGYPRYAELLRAAAPDDRPLMTPGQAAGYTVSYPPRHARDDDDNTPRQ